MNDTRYGELNGVFSLYKSATMNWRMQPFRLVIVNHVRTNFYRLWSPMSIDFGHQSL